MIDDPNKPPFGGGGMSKEERRDSHERWAAQLDAPWKSPDSKENKMAENGTQCGGCAFYIALESDLGMDWGCCANAKSKFDGRVVFEHHVCVEHTVREEKGEECPDCDGVGHNSCKPCKGTGVKGGAQ